MVLELMKLKAAVLKALKILQDERWQNKRALSTGGQLPDCLSRKEEKDTWAEGFTEHKPQLYVYSRMLLFVYARMSLE